MGVAFCDAEKSRKLLAGGLFLRSTPSPLAGLLHRLKSVRMFGWWDDTGRAMGRGPGKGGSSAHLPDAIRARRRCGIERPRSRQDFVGPGVGGDPTHDDEGRVWSLLAWAPGFCCVVHGQGRSGMAVHGFFFFSGAGGAVSTCGAALSLQKKRAIVSTKFRLLDQGKRIAPSNGRKRCGTRQPGFARRRIHDCPSRTAAPANLAQGA